MDKGCLKLTSTQSPACQLNTPVSLPHCFVTVISHPTLLLKIVVSFTPSMFCPHHSFPDFSESFALRFSFPGIQLTCPWVMTRQYFTNQPLPHSRVPSLLGCSSLLLELHVICSQSEIAVTCQIKSKLFLRLSISLTI